MTSASTTRSQLVYREERAAGVGALIALHADGGDGRELIGPCRSAAPALDLFAPQAPRSRNPFLSSGERPGPYAGYAWYRSGPEPSSFGDALWQVEQFVYDVRDRCAGGIWLLGHREGAVLALAAGALLHDVVRGVVALRADAPRLEGWSAPVVDLPVLNLEQEPAHAVPVVREWLRKEGERWRATTRR